MKDHLAALTRVRLEGLALAREIQCGNGSVSWSREQQRARTLEYFDRARQSRFKAGEACLFPLVESFFPQQGEVLGVLKKQHSQLGSLATQLRAAVGGQLENLLLRFAHVLEAHLKKEEWLFQRIGRTIPETTLEACGEEIERYLDERATLQETPGRGGS